MEAAEAEESPEVHQEIEELWEGEDEGVLGEGEEEEVSVLGEVEGAIPISQGLAIGAEDHEIKPGVAAEGLITIMKYLRRYLE